jgi:tRNA threonylcarbamoyladenosine biosynthesis protein TsaB
VKLLALDTATENCSAALLLDSNVYTREFEMERGHAERILPMIDDLLSKAGLALTDLDAIAFGRGPGSFTGIRLGATVTQGLAFGAGLGVVPISDLQAVAQRALDDDATRTRILVCNDARMSEVYWACYERGGDDLARLEGIEQVTKPAQVQLPVSWPTATAAGRGFIAYADALRSAVPTVPFPTTANAAPLQNDPIHYLPRALEVARLALPAVTAGHLLPPEEALPIYLRDNVVHVSQPQRPPVRDLSH